MTLTNRPIGQESNQQMLEILLSSPMESEGLSLCLDRSPNIFAVPEIFFNQFKAYGFYIGEELSGFAMICRKKLYVNGVPKEIGYLANLYVKPEGRKKGWLYKASESLFREVLEEVRFGFATTIKGNRNTEPMIGRRIEKFPFIPYSVTATDLELRNILITFGKRKKYPFAIRQATETDIPEIARLLDQEYKNRLFGPVCTEDELRKTISIRPGFSIQDYYVAFADNRMVGVCSAWDLREIRRLRVMAYRKSYRIIKNLYNGFGPILGFPRLPETGEAFREITLNDFAVENRDPKILEALLSRIYSDYRRKGYNLLQIASYEGDPLLSTVSGYISQPLYSRVILGFADPAYLTREGIDSSKPYIDIALT